ncbi:hypothetical protein ACEWPM_001810 [Roseovarius sp. S4756]|uniref:hypothetical protein n=1 Tax=Roseovarius maritimus TaxID=3342637 RepID=UPI003726767D
MVSNSKILTVSYGTFSCTLEGFDDSFDTMKAIAEYFRDLAADDRYFGAEPPSPDAEMLARIAEREISRRVEARGTDGKIHLRADPASLPAAEAAKAEMPQSEIPESETAKTETPKTEARAAEADDDAAQAEAPEASGPQGEMAAAPEEETSQFADAPREPAFKAPAATAVSESIADKLRRIRAVAAPAGTGYAAPGFDEDEHAQDFLTDTALSDASLAVDESAMDDDADLALAEGLSGLSDAWEDDIGLDEAEGTLVGASDQGGDDSVPDVSDAPEAEPSLQDEIESDDEAEDNGEEQSLIAPEPSEPVSAPEEETANIDDGDVITPLAAADAPEIEVEADHAMAEDASSRNADDADEQDLEEMLRAAEATWNDDAIEEDENIFGEDEAQSGDDDTLSQLLADAMGSERATTDVAVDKTADDIDEDDEDERADLQDAEPPLAARVIKMKRSDLDAALASGDLEAEMDAADRPSDLSPEAEAELQRELAEVEAELQHARAPETVIPDVTHAPMDDKTQAEDATLDEADEDMGRDDADHAEEDRAEEDEAASLLAEKDKSDDEEARVEETAPIRASHLGTPASDAQAARIFDEANTQLEEPEANQRRSAIQHLRAAVAATRAERRAGSAMEADVDDQPYRKDLQSAVRPRRPRPLASGTTPRPSTNPAARPAPLKLVAEQRVDTPTQPVRPRRITRADLATAPAPDIERPQHAEQEDAPGFAEFAEQMGANSLTDMLEAAAAYMADVEGMPQFSRPMLMQKLREAQEDEFTREDGLRSFGLLLRQGKLQKLKGGRFAVTSVTEFRRSA